MPSNFEKLPLIVQGEWLSTNARVWSRSLFSFQRILVPNDNDAPINFDGSAKI